ncbi:hypothetical protein SAMN05892883_1632 [Jatrophihabitans sp. GAS493]|uniref:DUF6069 family protein n=1 Tax=Jatrophihabitans sp. GAS493 TaxID=1907575 RepID=UPI000BB73379|nr:DUF6069 family protein [Jatrophihabitans sp. GAS493]SOD72213.1 hypothetical protein SAMN05892883_1632 [Jatrophihabitans sp. GAS493]
MPNTITAENANASSSTRASLWWPGVSYAVVAAAATIVVAALAHALGASLEVDGEVIPLLAFAQLTFIFSMIGVALAALLRRRVGRPATAFVRLTLVLTGLSFLPDLLTPHIDAATRVTLLSTHIVAAAIVIPRVAARLR